MRISLRNVARIAVEAGIDQVLGDLARRIAPFIDKAKNAGIIIVPPLKVALERHLGRSVAPSTVYLLLQRHGWRKLAPDKRHPQSDPVAQDERKKNSPKSSRKSAKSGRGSQSG